jgi:DtxR family transcriptional regulator, Mn-dependent transcriptional regulator
MAEAQLSAQMEDYLEAILELCGDHGVARVKHISERLGVTRPSVVGAIRSLKRRQLVEQEPYGFVRLTAEGEDLARAVAHRHEVLSDFLENVLGLDGELAARDACKIEHAASAETIQRLRAAAELLQSETRAGNSWAKAFAKFYRGKRKHPTP